MKSNVGFKILRIAYIISLLSWFGTAWLIEFHLVHDPEGFGLLWGLTFGVVGFICTIVYLIIASRHHKSFHRIDWVLFVVAALMVLIYVGFAIVEQIVVQKQISDPTFLHPGVHQTGF